MSKGKLSARISESMRDRQINPLYRVQPCVLPFKSTALVRLTCYRCSHFIQRPGPSTKPLFRSSITIAHNIQPIDLAIVTQPQPRDASMSLVLRGQAWWVWRRSYRQNRVLSIRGFLTLDHTSVLIMPQPRSTHLTSPHQTPKKVPAWSTNLTMAPCFSRHAPG